MTTTAKVIPLPITVALECSECGAKGEGSCRCGVPYVPAGERAAKAIEANPEKSDRAIAAESGISRATVQRARKAGGSHEPPEKRKGRDGKNYPSKAPTAKKRARIATTRPSKRKPKLLPKTAPLNQQTNNLTRSLGDFIDIWCDAATNLECENNLKPDDANMLSLMQFAEIFGRNLQQWVAERKVKLPPPDGGELDDDDQGRTPEERWQNNLAHLCGDILARRELWRRYLNRDGVRDREEKWKGFSCPDYIKTLVYEATVAMFRLATDLGVDADAERQGGFSK